jgi:hypothetical protein
MHVAGSERASFQVPELVEHEERMVASATEVPVPNAALLITMRRAYARIHIENNAFAGSMLRDQFNPTSGKIGESCQVLWPCKPVRLEASHLAW